MGKESAKKIMSDILANSPEFAAQMEAARKVETGESDKPVIVKLTGRFDNPQITNETMAEKPIAPVRRRPVLSGAPLSFMMEWERKFEVFLGRMFEDLHSSGMDADEMDDVVEQFIKRNDIDEEWIDYKDNVDDEVPGQDERDYPQSFLE